MLDVSVVTEQEVVAEFNRRGYFVSVVEPAPPGVEPPAPPELPPGVEPPPPPGIEPPEVVLPVEKERRNWLWFALGLVVVSMAVEEEGE